MAQTGGEATPVCLLFLCQKPFTKNKDFATLAQTYFATLAHSGSAVIFQQWHFPCQQSRLLVKCQWKHKRMRTVLWFPRKLAPISAAKPRPKSKTHLGFQFISKVGVIEVHKAKKQGTLLSDAVIFGNLFLHVLFQECHVAEKTTGKGPEQLEQQFYVSVIPSAGSNEKTG